MNPTPRRAGAAGAGAAPRSDRPPAAGRPLGILHVAAPAPTGGLERVLHALAARQRAAGHDAHVAAVLAEGADAARHPFVRALRADGVPVHAVVVGPRDYRGERARIAALCDRLRPDVLHTHGYRPNVVDAGIARRRGIPTLTTVHGFTGNGWRNRAYEWLQRRAYRRFDAVIAVSIRQLPALLRAGVPADRLHLVRNAWDGRHTALDRAAARAALRASAGRALVGWAGRLTREKGPDVLLDALARIAVLPLDVAIIGDGRDRPALQDRARLLGIANRVRWHGHVDDARRLFAAFDAFVLSSRTEGTPIVLFEAMAAGAPIVATHVGGVPNVVVHGETGLLVPPEDPAALADAIRATLDDAVAAARRARAARARLDDVFAPGPWLASYETLYRRVCAAGAGAEP